MPDYRDFVNMARERREKAMAGAARSGVLFTRHAEYKMRQYGLSMQRVRSVIRNPRRREEGIAKDTVAVMQPPSVKRKDGKETWTQEIWVMFTIAESRKSKVESRNPKAKGEVPKVENRDARTGNREAKVKSMRGGDGTLRVISAWRYPGVSPKRNPVPDEILREIEEGSILEEGIIC